MRRAAAALCAVLCGVALPCAAEERQALRIAFHVHTSISDGAWTAKQVLTEAQRLGLDGVVFADSLLERWEYGLPPLRWLLRRTLEHPSVLTVGAAKYLRHLHELQRDFPEVIVIPGVTVAPFYRWTDIPMLRHGRLESWHRQLIVLGLEQPRALTELPAVSNSYASWWILRRFPWKMWPLPFLIGGVLLWWKRRRASAGLLWAPVCFVLVGLLGLGNADLRATSRFHPYQRDPGAAPYQAVIDAVTARGGLVFWSHPELDSDMNFHGVPVVTAAHPELLGATQGFLGFGMNYWSYVQTLAPGDRWDQLLAAYCRGQRTQPAWLLGEVAWHDPARPLDMVETVVLAQARTAEALLQAVREGRMYAQFNPSEGRDVELEECHLLAPAVRQTATLGGTLHCDGPVAVHVTGRHRGGPESPAQLTIVRNGATVYTEALASSSFNVVWQEQEPPQQACSYYRVAITHGPSAIYTNPCFVRRSTSHESRVTSDGFHVP